MQHTAALIGYQVSPRVTLALFIQEAEGGWAEFRVLIDWIHHEKYQQNVYRGFLAFEVTKSSVAQMKPVARAVFGADGNAKHDL